MGADKYIQELWRKKQSDVMRFLPAVRCWPYRPLFRAAPRPPPPARQGSVICRVRVCHGGRKRPVPKGATFGKPVHRSVNPLKFARSLQSWITKPVHKHGEMQGLTSAGRKPFCRGRGKGYEFHLPIGGSRCEAWRGSVLSNPTATANISNVCQVLTNKQFRTFLSA
ncbi:hypothetical protein FD755_003642 [Muntiacus reevesi]|uniref:Ribosomal protein L15 n=1 Tax=Muntiacus reevesi TaxID=9886 RepID=A0A5J5MNH6_MUNRE|nr:hypothetical protein FD755_003642 [Muntiacus reevesi]